MAWPTDGWKAIGCSWRPPPATRWRAAVPCVALLAAGVWLRDHLTTGGAGHEGVGATPASQTRIAPPERDPASDLLHRLREHAAAESDPVAREASLDAAARGIPRARFGQLLATLAAADSHATDAEIVRAVALRWAWEEPTGAAAWALGQPPNAIRQEVLGAAAAGWAKRAPDQLFGWAGTLAPEDREWVLHRAAAALMQDEPETYLLLHASMAPSRERDQLGARLAWHWAARDPVGLARAVAQYQAPELASWRNAATSALASFLAQEQEQERRTPGPAVSNDAVAAEAVTSPRPPGNSE